MSEKFSGFLGWTFWKDCKISEFYLPRWTLSVYKKACICDETLMPRARSSSKKPKYIISDHGKFRSTIMLCKNNSFSANAQDVFRTSEKFYRALMKLLGFLVVFFFVVILYDILRFPQDAYISVFGARFLKVYMNLFQKCNCVRVQRDPVQHESSGDIAQIQKFSCE